MATIERTRCWFVPMRPVTPFMMMPRRCWVILNAFRMTEDRGRTTEKQDGLGSLSSVLGRLSSVVRHQQPVDAPGIFAEFLAGLHFERARMGKLDLEIIRHARWTRGEHDDARAEKDRLA